MQKPIIFFEDACCASGKTTSLVKRLNKKKFDPLHPEGDVIAQPTKLLLKQTKGQLKKAYRIDSDTALVSAWADYKMIMARDGDFTSKVLVTHNTVLNNPEVRNRKLYNLWVDEFWQPIEVFEVNMTLTQATWKEGLDVEDAGGDAYRLVITDIPLIKKKVKNKRGDEFAKKMQIFYSRLSNKHYEIVIDKYEWDNADRVNLHFVCILLPSIVEGWKQVTMMGANFKTSSLYHAWKDQVDFRESNALQIENRLHTDRTGKRLKIIYFGEVDWSKYNRDLIGLDNILDNLAPHLPAKFIWNANNDVKGDVFGEEHMQNRLPAHVHGLNNYRDHTCVVSLMSINFRAQFSRFIQKRFNITKDDMMKSLVGEFIYQTIMRSNLREHKSDKEVVVYVPARNIGEHLQSLFPGSTIEYLDLGIEKLKAKKAKTDGERQANKRKRNRIAYDNCFEKFDETITMTYEGALNSTEIREEKYVSGASFIEFLYALHCLPSDGKDDNILFTATSFNNTKIKKRDVKEFGVRLKGLENFLKAEVLLFDFDDTAMPPKIAHEQIFNGYQHVIYNTASNGKVAGKFRYRVVVLLSHAIVKPEAYKSCCRHFFDKVEALGFDGIDKGKATPVSFMYVPCQPKDPENAIWFEDRQSPRFDPTNIQVEVEVARPVMKLAHRLKKVSDKASDMEESIRKYEGPNGHDGIFKAAMSMGGKNVPKDDAKSALRDNAHRFGTNRNDRLRGLETTVDNAYRLAGR